MTKKEFITAATKAARKSSAASSLPAGVTVAQAALESAWGASRLAQKAANYFGIKARGDAPFIAMPTSEVIDGVEQKTTARFARYASMEECFAARDRIILTAPIYAEARGHAAESEAFIHSLAKHWATDPAYAEKLWGLYREYGFDHIDKKNL
jgi:flagellum-specific peptidoglycan hydrolase FlgJ